MSMDDSTPDAAIRDRLRPLTSWLFDHYWRVETRGLEHIPEQGPVLLIGNHSGTLPLDAAMIAHAVEGARGRTVRPLYDRWADNQPRVASVMKALGGVTASYRAAEDLLTAGEAVLIFPEGVAGVAKLFSERYRLRGFATSAGRLALKHRVPIVPFGLVGAEEASPMLARSLEVGEKLGLPYLPMTAGAAVVGPLGLLPLPTKWVLRFGRRIYLHRERRFATNPDPEIVAQRLQRAVQNQLSRELGKRRSLFLG
ncbi:MAG: 1-acyl-sn-glycerol-3-phosphate acyltransferase [Hyphomicrobiaceae bacterium]|jgi:1-acyl-sn-glycerol-3-phosphate acyltransferase